MVARALVLFLCLFVAAARADSLAVVPPLAPGPYAVGCSNLSQDFTRVRSGETAQVYWEGTPDNGRARYITDLLSDPGHTLRVDVTLPNDSELFGDFAGKDLSTVLLVCYPTGSQNARPDYPLLGGHVIPHMQTGAETALFADANARYPVLLFSVGLAGSPISDETVDALTAFASYGYVVVAPFHADERISLVHLSDIRDALFALINFKSFIAMQAVRPVTLKAALDLVLSNPQFAAHVDANRVGAFGGSLGAESSVLMTGARLTTSIGQSSKTVLRDPRVRAVVGYVPYFGQDFYPAFGRDQDGLSGITVPFLGIAGTADTTAPISATEKGVRRLGGSRILVALKDVPHGFDVASTNDIFTWSLTFLAAHVQDDKLARARIARMQKVAGGGDDSTIIDYTAPSDPASGEATVVEYHRAANDHYFMTAYPNEIAVLDTGTIPGWARTGFAFKAWAPGSSLGLVTHRFYGTPGIGPDTHFYTNLPAELTFLAGNRLWTYEGIAFNADPAVAGDCAPDRIPVTRLYNDGKGGEANHRYLTSRSETAAMVAQGWLVEGPVFCSLP